MNLFQELTRRETERAARVHDAYRELCRRSANGEPVSAEQAEAILHDSQKTIAEFSRDAGIVASASSLRGRIEVAKLREEDARKVQGRITKERIIPAASVGCFNLRPDQMIPAAEIGEWNDAEEKIDRLRTLRKQLWELALRHPELVAV